MSTSHYIEVCALRCSESLQRNSDYEVHKLYSELLL